jgi:hypothetical protein
VAADVAAGGGDVGCAGESVQADGEIAQSAHYGGTGAGADLGMILGEDDVADPVQAVLDAPVPADRLGEVIGADLVPGQVDDRVDGLGVPFAAGR